MSETKRMIVLVSPEGCLHRVADEEALDALAQTLNIHADVAKYLRQMCNFRKLPGDKRNSKHRAFGWAKLEDVRWLRRKNDDRYVVVFGAAASEFYKSSTELKAEITFAQFEKLIGARGHAGEWEKVDQPPGVNALADGVSIIGLRDSGLPLAGQKSGGTPMAGTGGGGMSAGLQVCLRHGFDPLHHVRCLLPRARPRVVSGPDGRFCRRSHRYRSPSSSFPTCRWRALVEAALWRGSRYGVGGFERSRPARCLLPPARARRCERP